MFHRFFVILYIALHFALLFSLTQLDNSYAWASLELKTYQARCIQNNQLVILEGSDGNTPYTFTDFQLKDLVFSDPLSTVRFYCAHYDEAKKYTDAYLMAVRNGTDVVKINQDFFAFQVSVPKTYIQNYSLEVVKVERNYMPLVSMFLDFVLFFVGIYLLIQIFRIIYQYIVFGKFNWHPYSKIVSE